MTFGPMVFKKDTKKNKPINCFGKLPSLQIPGETLYIMEVQPAAYAALAANEAEKAAEINILDVRSFGSFGRLYLGGEERDIEVGWQAAVKVIEEVTGKENKENN